MPVFLSFAGMLTTITITTTLIMMWSTMENDFLESPYSHTPLKGLISEINQYRYPSYLHQGRGREMIIVHSWYINGICMGELPVYICHPKMERGCRKQKKGMPKKVRKRGCRKKIMQFQHTLVETYLLNHRQRRSLAPKLKTQQLCIQQSSILINYLSGFP